MSLKLIKEAQALSTIKSKKQLENIKSLQQNLGISLQEATKLYEQQFSAEITPEDYDEWLRQIVLQSENLRRAGLSANLNKKSVFMDLVGEILENDPAGKVDLGGNEFGMVADILWKKYQQAKSETRLQNAMKAKEEEERSRSVRYEDEESDLDYDQRSEQRMLSRRQAVSDARSHHYAGEYDSDFDDFEDGFGDDFEDEESNIMVGPEPELAGTKPASNYDVEDEYYTDCPYDEGTPEHDAWMAGYEAAMDEQGDDEDVGSDEDIEGDDEGMDDYESDELDQADIDNEDVDAGIGTEEEEQDHYTRGYRAAQREYRGGRAASKRKAAHPEWERGYEDFMGDTEGQRELQRKVVKQGQEDEEKLTLKSILNGPKETLNKAVKDKENDGARAFHAMEMPKNPHDERSMAHKAWARGFKNAAKEVFGFFEKPVATKPKAKKKK